MGKEVGVAIQLAAAEGRGGWGGHKTGGVGAESRC